MTVSINKINAGGDLTLTSGELDEVNYAKTGANLSVTTAVEFDEVSITSVIDGVVRRDFSTGSVAVAGSFNELAYFADALFTVPGTYSWTAPAGVTSVDVICIGGGGSGGGADGGGGGGGVTAYINNYTVTPGSSYTVVVGAGGAAAAPGVPGNAGGDSYFVSVTTCRGGGGSGGATGSSAAGGAGGTIFQDGSGGGGAGGAGGSAGSNINGSQGGGGGGAGGYGSAGGRGHDGSAIAALGTISTTGANGGGGGGGAGAGLYGNGNGTGAGAGGGGVDVYGRGTNGTRGIGSIGTPGDGTPGGGGSGGTAGGDNVNNFVGGQKGGDGGLYGGGGGGASGQGNGLGATQPSGKGGDGAVRILWNTIGLSSAYQSFPVTNVGRQQAFRYGESFSFSTVVDSPFVNPWNTALTQVVTVTFTNAIDQQMFFKLGGNIYIAPFYSNTGVITSSKDISWANLLDSVGFVYYTFNNFITKGNVLLTERFAAGDYSANNYKVWAQSFESNSSVTITSLFDDASVDPQVDDFVSVVDVRNNVGIYRSTAPITTPAPTLTLNKALSLR